MRNLFDQYSHPENRLTHAMACCLHEDRDLLKRFLAWLRVTSPVAARSLVIGEQTLPGDPPETEQDADRKGLPDIVIHDNESWCLLIESKVQARLTEDQLRRHERTLRRRGFERIYRVVLTKDGVAAPGGTIGLTWSGLYEWLGGASQRGEWSDRMRGYLRAAEVRLAREGYLTEGTLTMFDGFPFSEDNPYTYGEAKRLLNLATQELRKDKRLRRIGMDPDAPGRSAITGRRGKVVWDFLSLKERPSRVFTAYPHLTLAIHAESVEVSITIPNGVAPAVRRRLSELGSEGLKDLNAATLRGAQPLIRAGAVVEAYAMQRHYPSQRSAAVTDAVLRFKLETSQPRTAGRVKSQPQWSETFADMLKQKRANVQFQYRVTLPFAMKGMDSRASLGLIVEGWLALTPLLEAIRDGSPRAPKVSTRKRRKPSGV